MKANFVKDLKLGLHASGHGLELKPKSKLLSTHFTLAHAYFKPTHFKLTHLPFIYIYIIYISKKH